MIKFEKVKAGMTLLDVHSYGVGNTTMNALGCWYVQVISVHADEQTATVKWNGNQAEIWRRARIERLYVKPPKKYRDQEARRAKGFSTHLECKANLTMAKLTSGLNNVK